jgi:hypothetical protein
MKAQAEEVARRMTFRMDDDDMDGYAEIREHLSPIDPSRFPATEVMRYCIRMTRQMVRDARDGSKPGKGGR